MVITQVLDQQLQKIPSFATSLPYSPVANNRPFFEWVWLLLKQIIAKCQILGQFTIALVSCAEKDFQLKL